MAALAGLVPWALSGMRTRVALLALVPEVGRGDEQGGQLALGPGGGLQRHGGQAGDLAEVVLHLVQDFEHALAGRVVLERVQFGQARQRRQALVPLGVVLHRTRAQRIEVRVDRHVLRREVDEVPDQVDLGDLRQRRRRRRPARRRAAARRAARSGTSLSGRRWQRRPWLAHLEQEGGGLVLFHESIRVSIQG